MSSSITAKIEYNTTNTTENNFQLSYLKMSNENLPIKKYKLNDEDSLIQNPEKQNEKNMANYNSNFSSMFKESLLNDDEISFENNELYFIKNLKEEKSLIKTINPELMNLGLNPYKENKKHGKIFFTRKKRFKVVYPEKYKGNKEDDFSFSKKKRSKIRQRRFTYKDLIEQKIKRNFCNKYLIKKLNDILKSEKSDLLFKKFSRCFITNVSKEDNDNILNMTLIQIFKEKKLYKKDLKNYLINLKVIDKLKTRKTKVNEILDNKKYFELYKEYLNSNEYQINIDKIKQKYKGKNEYIKRFNYFSKNFLELFKI